MKENSKKTALEKSLEFIPNPPTICKLCNRKGHLKKHCNSLRANREAAAHLSQAFAYFAFPSDEEDDYDNEAANILFQGMNISE